jgi:hypothetical protein
MSSYCECGDVATIFYDADGVELYQPMCETCYTYLVEDTRENAPELFAEYVNE